MNVFNATLNSEPIGIVKVDGTVELNWPAIEQSAASWQPFDNGRRGFVTCVAKMLLTARRQSPEAFALKQWLDKTEWIIKTAQPSELGMHRADALRSRLAALELECKALRARVEALSATPPSRSLEQELRDALAAMGSKRAQDLSAGDLMGLVCRADEPPTPQPVALVPLTPEETDLIAADGMRSATGGIYATQVYEFSAQVQHALAAKNGATLKGGEG